MKVSLSASYKNKVLVSLVVLSSYAYLYEPIACAEDRIIEKTDSASPCRLNGTDQKYRVEDEA